MSANSRPSAPDADALYDSAAVPHATRWGLPLPSREQTLQYMRKVRDRVIEQIEKRPSKDLSYFVKLAVFHEDMHGEAFLYTRQTLEYPAPPSDADAPARSLARASGSAPEGGPLPGDVAIPGGTFLLGAAGDELFVFDNEKWAHKVPVKPFRIARATVTQGEFAAFVEDGGYRSQALWSREGWGWKQRAGAEQPVYWRSPVPGSRLGAAAISSAGSPRASPTDPACELVRGRCVLSLGRAPPADRSRMGNGGRGRILRAADQVGAPANGASPGVMSSLLLITPT